VRPVADIATVPLFDIVDDLHPPLDVGGDWAVFRPDGVMTLDVRLTLRTHDDAVIVMTYNGRWVRPAEVRYYFRTTPLFETGDARYLWLNDVVAIGSGYLVEGGVAYRVSQVV